MHAAAGVFHKVLLLLSAQQQNNKPGIITIIIRYWGPCWPKKLFHKTHECINPFLFFFKVVCASFEHCGELCVAHKWINSQFSDGLTSLAVLLNLHISCFLHPAMNNQSEHLEEKTLPSIHLLFSSTGCIYRWVFTAFDRLSHSSSFQF